MSNHGHYCLAIATLIACAYGLRWFTQFLARGSDRQVRRALRRLAKQHSCGERLP